MDGYMRKKKGKKESKKERKKGNRCQFFDRMFIVGG
jgi:hypothetical protein